MESLVRIVVENWLTYTRLSDPRVDDDDACRQIEMVNRHIVHADLEMNELFLRVMQEMADESRDGDDEERTDMLDAMPAEIGVSLNEDEIEEEKDDPTNPAYHPELRPRLEDPLGYLLGMIAEDLLFYSIFDVEPNYAREQWARIGYQLRQEPAATIQAFVAFTRGMADGISEQRFQQSKDLLLSMPYDLGLLPDPR